MQPPLTMPPDAPAAFHVLAKPAGAICNLDCQYCFFLSKEVLYPGSRFRMTGELLEAYLRGMIESQPQMPEITVAWQGGEPTLMGLDFFRRSIEYERQYARPGLTILNTIQTNGTLLDDEWCEFLRENHFLAGLSLDGPREMHDAYRRDKGGKPTFDRVMRAARLMQAHNVDFNILCTVNAANAGHPLEVYRFFRDEVGAQFVQFIPIVERTTAEMAALANDGWGEKSKGARPLYVQEGDLVTARSVKPAQWGDFLSTVFDEWVRRDVAKVYVQMFDAALASWYGEGPALCIFAETCGDALALEHNGDLYSCDHFVEPKYLLGNILEHPMIELVASPQQRRFGTDKRDTLPRYCRECEVRCACHGECPRNRFILAPDGEPGLNYLCAGYKAFFRHVDEPMRFMTNELRRDGAPANVMAHMARRDAEVQRAYASAGRNDPCPCGSGKKFKHCHGRPTRADA
jgi:uncharacterized protein